MEDTAEKILNKHIYTQVTLYNPLDEDYTGYYDNKRLVIPAKKKVSVGALVAKVIARHLARYCITIIDKQEIENSGQRVESVLIGGHYVNKWLAEIYSCNVEDIDEQGNPPVLNTESEGKEDTIIATEMETPAEVDNNTVPISAWKWQKLQKVASSLGLTSAKVPRPELERLVQAKLTGEEA